MEPWEFVLTALATGAATGVGDAASTTVRDAYSGLRSLAAKALRRGTAGLDDADVAAALSDPEEHRAELAAALSDAGVEEDEELIAAARRVLELAGIQDPAARKYSVVLRDNKGVQVGDNNTQTNTFGS